MCTNPITIKRPVSSSPYRNLNTYLGISAPTGAVTVPCGKCCECLSYKHNKRVPQLVNAMQHCGLGKTQFVTLTYSNDSLPLMLSHKLSDGVELLPLSTDYLRDTFIQLSGISMTKTVKSTSFDISGSEYAVTPSLRREDVRLYIKSQRKAFQMSGRGEEFDFKMICVGEYGPRTNRPHYHLLLFGMDYVHTCEFFDQWRKRFGFICVKPVNKEYTSKKGRVIKDGYVAVARYVSKYMSKGCFECPYVKDGLCEKPRTCTSVHLGCDLSSQLVDLVFPINLITDCIEDNFNALYRYVQNRSVIISGMRFPIPDAWKRKYLYKCLKYEKVNSDGSTQTVYYYQASTLQNSLSCVILARLNDVRTQSYESFQAQYPGLPPDEVCRLFKSEMDALQNSKEKSRFADLRKFYSESVF